MPVDKAEIANLVERLRQATGPDRDLDWRIADVTNHPSFEKRFEHMWPPFGPKSKLDRDIPHYTASTDAALALVERLLPGWMVVNLCEWDAGILRSRGPWNCTLKKLGTQDDLSATKGECDHAPTAPVAILLALLTALGASK